MRKEQVEFIAVLSREYPDTKTEIIAELAWRLMKLARKADRNAVNLCNIPNYADKRDEIKENILKVKAEYAEFLKNGVQAFGYKLGGDPRGYTLKLFLPSRRYNTWGGEEEGYGVPC